MDERCGEPPPAEAPTALRKSLNEAAHHSALAAASAPGGAPLRLQQLHAVAGLAF